MSHFDPRLPKLNPLALPSQGNILFAAIVFVLFVAVTSSGISPSPICATLIILGIFSLSLRAFLAWPDREIAKHALAPADESYTSLQIEIAKLSELIGLHLPPLLLIANHPITCYAFGSFHRRYIAVNQEFAQELISALSDTATATRARAMLLYELFHFRNGAVWQVGYSREVLRTMFVLLSWSVALLTGIAFLAMVTLSTPLPNLAQVSGLDPSMRLERTLTTA